MGIKIISKENREKELEFNSKNYYDEVMFYSDAGITIVNELPNGKYMVLGGYTASIISNNSKVYANVTNCSNVFCGVLLYNLSAVQKGAQNIYFLQTNYFPIKNGARNDILSYIGATFKLNGGEINSKGYIDINSLKFNNLNAEVRAKNLSALIDDIKPQNAKQKKLINSILNDSKIIFNDELTK